MQNSNSKTPEIPSLSKTVVVPNPVGTGRDMNDKRFSVVSSTGSILSDVSLENGEATHLHRSLKKTKLQRRRKRLSTLLHTHVVLILVVSLSALDAACVIGQIICDVLIMRESIDEWQDLDSNLTALLWNELPEVLNTSDHQSPESLDLYQISGILWAKQHYLDRYFQDTDYGFSITHALSARSASSGELDVTRLSGTTFFNTTQRTHFPLPFSRNKESLNELLQSLHSSLSPEILSSRDVEFLIHGLLRFIHPHQPSIAPDLLSAEDDESLNKLLKLLHPSHPSVSPGPLSVQDDLRVPHRRRKRAAAGGGPDGEGSQLYDLTHYFHLGSMIILSALLLECFLKVFAMGKKLCHHKLEMFDIFVVSVSWSLDVAFWDGIWAHPETEAATILIVMLPWRVIRIINSFVLVIQEKDHVELKIVKQRLRLAARKGKDVLKKATSYKAEVKQLQSLCRKYGASDTELLFCVPADRRQRRSRGSLTKPVILSHTDSSLSLTASTLQAFAMPDYSSSSDEDGVGSTAHDLTSKGGRQEPSVRSGTLDEVFVKEATTRDAGNQVEAKTNGVATAPTPDHVAIGGVKGRPGCSPQEGNNERQDNFTRL